MSYKLGYRNASYGLYTPRMEQKDTILIVDDDVEIRQLLCKYLGQHEFKALSAMDGKGMWAILDKHRVNLIVLDLMLPGDDGLVLCRNLRSNSKIPVIMLTARGEETERIIGLEMGADDYLAKPFNPRELLARIKSVLRRSELSGAPLDGQCGQKYQFEGWTLDTVTRQLVSPDDVLVSLSGGEYQLLLVFVTHPNRILSRDQLLDFTRGRDLQPFDRSVDVMVSRLRRVLQDKDEPKIIKTVRNEGYVFTAKVEIDQ